MIFICSACRRRRRVQRKAPRGQPRGGQFVIVDERRASMSRKDAPTISVLCGYCRRAAVKQLQREVFSREKQAQVS